LSLQLKTILERLSKCRRGKEFDFADRLLAEQKTLRKSYGIKGAVAADILDDTGLIGGLVDEASLICLYHLGEFWREIPVKPAKSKLAAKIRSAAIPWWRLAFELDCERGTEPDMHEVGSHPMYTPDLLVNRFIGECSIKLADHYHHWLVGKVRGKTSRSEEHDVLLAQLADASPSFAKLPYSEQDKKHLKIANTYRRIEHIRSAFEDEAPVVLGGKAFEEKITGKRSVAFLKGKDGKRYTLDKVQDYFRNIANLPTLGEWEKAKDPSKATAMARAVLSSGTGGIAISADFTSQSFGMALLAQRETGSAIQDRLRRYLISEFGDCPDFYFVVERGLGQVPHLHGAVEMEPTSANRDRMRKVLLKLSRIGKIDGYASWADAQPLRTPARWGAYPYKHPLTSQSKTGVSSLLYATQSLRQKARVEWGKMRQEQNDARAIMKRVKGKG